MNTWASLIIPLPNYLTYCQEPEAWASGSPDVSFSFLVVPAPFLFLLVYTSSKKPSQMTGL